MIFCARARENTGGRKRKCGKRKEVGGSVEIAGGGDEQVSRRNHSEGCCGHLADIVTSETLARRRANLPILTKVPYICLLALTFHVYATLQLHQDFHPAQPENITDTPTTSTLRILSLEEFLAKTQDQNDDQNNRSTVDSAPSGQSRGDDPKRAAAIRHQLEREESVTDGSVESSSTALARIETTTTTASSRHSPSGTDAQQQQQPDGHVSKKHGHEQPAPTGGNKTKPIPQHWQVKSLLNVTHDYPLAYSQIICGYVWPLMAALTLFTNLMIVFVLTQHDMRTPTNVVLTAIAIADIIPIVVPVPWFVYLFAMGNEKQVLYPPVACYFYQHSTRSVSEIFYFLSTWLNVLLAIQDYLTACQPQLAKKYCQIRIVIYEIVILTLLAFLLNLPQALKLVFKPVKFFYNGKLTDGCKALQAKWFKELVGEYVAIYDDVFTAIIVVCVDGGPALALITLTALLIKQLQRQRIRGHMLMEQARTASKRRRERHRQQEYESSARVMIFVLLAFLAVKIPFATTYTLMIIQSRFEIHFVENLVDFQKAITLTDLVFVLSYPINFTIFCCCSKKFRHKCAQLLSDCDKNAKSTRGRLMRSLSGSLTGNSTYNSQRSSLRSVTAGQQQQQQQVGKWTQQASIVEDGGQAEEEIEPNGGLAESDKQRLIVMDRSCDGSNHLQRNDVQLAAPEVAFRALLADGSLCYECLVRYERFMRYEQAARRHSLGAATPINHLLTTTSVADESTREPQVGSPKRLSDESLSWPPVFPPPPPPIQLGKYHLPHIVTTRCESIREQPSSDEAGAESGDQWAQPALAPESDDGDRDPQELHQQQQVSQSHPQQQQLTGQSSRKSSRASTCSTNNWGPTSSDDLANEVADEDGSTRRKRSERQSRRQQQRRQHQQDRQNRSRHRKFMVGPWKGGQRATNSPSGKRNTSGNSGKRGSSDPGSTSGFLNIKHLSQLVVRRSTGHLGEHSARGQPSLCEDEHQRSLSLSNSKLSTLPNATAQLADVLMSTLIFAGKQEHKSGRQPRGAGQCESAHQPQGHLLSSLHWYTRHHHHKPSGRDADG